MNSILINKLSKKFENEKDFLFKNISLQFEQGKIYCITGPSGCGKTTLLNMISGIDINYEGKIEINGIDQKELIEFDKRTYFNKMVSYIQQDNLLFEKLSIKDNYNTINLLNSNYDDPANYLVNVNYSNNKKVVELSGGEQKRIQILEGISKESFILLADEPTSNLDYENSSRIMQLIIQNKNNKIIIFVTHNVRIANEFADIILQIENGKIKKNYNKKCRKSDIKSDTSFPISQIKANISSNKFIKSEKKNNKMFVGASIITIIALGLSLSLSMGLKSFFRDQTENTNNYSYITMTQNNKLDEPNEEELNYLNNNFDSSFFFAYLKNDTITYLNDKEIVVPNYIHNMPYEYISTLEEDDIVISISNDYRAYLEYLFNCENLDDYIEENNLTMTINYYNGENTLRVVDVMLNETSDFIIYSSNPNLYHLFHKENDQKVLTIKKINFSENIATFFNSSNNYKIISNGDYYFIYKYNQQYINIESIHQVCDKALPIIENNNCYWINYYEGILYFNNCQIFMQNNLISETIYYSPFKDELSLGRMYEENDEIVISTKLAEKYALTINDQIEIKNNDITVSYKIVGLIENNDLYIYQSPSWAYEYFVNTYNPERFLLKTNNYIIFEDPSKIQQTINNLKTYFPNYNYYSPVKEVIDSVDEIANLIIYIGFGVTGVLLIVSILSLIILSKIEKINYQKQIYSLRCIGLQNKDLNKIYFNINLKRFLLTIFVSFITLIIVSFATNFAMDKSGLIEGFSLQINVFIYIILLGVCLVIYSTNYLINKLK